MLERIAKFIISITVTGQHQYGGNLVCVQFTCDASCAMPCASPVNADVNGCCVAHPDPQVKETSLVQHTVEGLAARMGQQVAAVVCPWKWPMPWSGRQRVLQQAEVQQQ